MKIETKFNVGDTVWYIKEESVYNNRCDHCGRTDYVNPSGVSWDIEREKVNSIFIDIYSDVSGVEIDIIYTLKNDRKLEENEAFATPEEAEASIEKDKE
jgi:hypothetical protein